MHQNIQICRNDSLIKCENNRKKNLIKKINQSSNAYEVAVTLMVRIIATAICIHWYTLVKLKIKMFQRNTNESKSPLMKNLEFYQNH